MSNINDKDWITLAYEAISGPKFHFHNVLDIHGETFLVTITRDETGRIQSAKLTRADIVIG